jgi:glycosyltransferase involved in cell wall biosynthesis
VIPVLHVISGLGTGGAESALVNTACALQKRGVSQHVVAIGGEDDHGQEFDRCGIEVTALGLASARQAPAGILRLARLIRRLKPAIIQGWMYHGNLMAALVHRLAGGRGSRQLLWNLRASNMDLARYGRVMRWSAGLSRWPDIVIANSEAGMRFHATQGFNARRFVVIANGIDTQRFRPDAVQRAAVRAELGIPTGAVVAMHAARVDPMKDHATFLTAMESLPGLVGIMAGAGTEALRSPPNVRALGLRRDMERLYAMADMIISTSAFGEGFSNTIAEGMSMGLVPIATDVGDAGRIVGDTGLIVAARDPVAVSAALAKIAAMPPSERAAQGLRARSRIVGQFSLERSVDAYEQLYRSLASEA